MSYRPFLTLNLLAFIFFTAACRQPITSKAAVLKYINDEDNHLLKQKEFSNGIAVKLLYLPSVLIGPARNSIGQRYFVLSFSKEGRELLSQLDQDSYSDMVRTLSFKMTPLISVVHDKRKAQPAEDCFFQQTYGMTGANELLIVFNPAAPGSSTQFKVIIKEFGLMLGDISFEFDENDIKRLNDILDNKSIIANQ